MDFLYKADNGLVNICTLGKATCYIFNKSKKTDASWIILMLFADFLSHFHKSIL